MINNIGQALEDDVRRQMERESQLQKQYADLRQQVQDLGISLAHR